MCSTCCQVGQKVLLFSAWGGTTCARPWKRNHWDAVTKCEADIPKWASTSQPHAALNAAMERSCKECGDLQRCRKMLQKTKKNATVSAHICPSVASNSKSITCQGTRHPKQKACCSARRSQHFSGTNAATSLPDKIYIKVWSRIEYNALNIRTAKSAKGCNGNVMECTRILHEAAWGCMRLHEDLDIISLRCLIAVVILHVRPSQIAKDW
jgi:hypothetical protein